MDAAPVAILAIDLGTSSAKALIVSGDGAVLARGQAAYATFHHRDGYDEQATADWLEAIATAVAGARRFAPDAAIEALTITGQMHGTVLLDDERQPLQPAIIWSDRRSADLVEPLRQRLGDSLPARIGGPLGAGYQALTLAWIRSNRPQLRDRIRHVALPVAAVGLALTGNLATDPSDAVSTGLFDARAARWDFDLLQAFGVEPEWLPVVVPTGSRIGTLTALAADRLGLPSGLPVHLGGGDAPAAAVGGGVRDSSLAMITLSTGAQVMRPVPVYEPEPSGRWHTWPAALPPGLAGDRWLSVGALLNGGRAIDWVHRLVAPQVTRADVLDLAQSAPAGAGGLVFLPYLAGERSPLLDPFARGAFVGLTDAHEPRHLVRAVLEGIAMALATALSAMTPPDRSLPGQIVFGGGGATSAMRQIVASVLGVPISVPATQESSALGAALIAAHALGWPDPAASDTWRAQAAAPVDPVPADRALYTELLGVFRDATRLTLPLMHRLGQQ